VRVSSGIPTDDPSPFDDRPSYEELSEQLAAVELVAETRAERIDELEARNLALESRIADLEQRLGRNPRNSSMPPSQEGFRKPPSPSRAERRTEQRRQGKQPGAPGANLTQVVDPDVVINHSPGACTHCGADLSDAEVIGVERRQVFDLPQIHPFVTEHRIERRRCRCGCEVKAAIPANATAPACYGPGVRALASYFAVHQHLPYDRMAQLFGDVLGMEVSTGALVQMVTEAGGSLGLFQDVVRDLLQDAPAVHFDETGGRVAGKLHWVHVASSALLTLIDCHERRGRVAMDDLGVIAKMQGIAVHDGWRPYRSYDVVHQLCNAHHLRELASVGVVWNQAWANELIALLVEAKDAVDAARATGQTTLSPSALHSVRTRYGTLIARGLADNPAPAVGRRHGRARTAANLLKRLDTERADVLRFTTNFDSPFDNNQAERDVRMVKLQQKISGSWRTLTGARNYTAIRSYISTMKKQDHDVLAGLRLLFEGDVWLPSGVART
jgi:transposase